ncbi:hypothetical protein HPB47_011537 [Ixodes persulcatus]|uniref:Uncharacterized protein n=1 Tax=Ixodes persulcatus TaxID=34615 RepID=A0AC60NW22_IXOPE|nr:hypothetical protein HPB47_011537 [Ixodes persulcatus]
MPTSTSASVNGAAVSSTINPDAYMVVRQRQQNIRALDLLQSTFVNETTEQQFLDLGCGPGDFTCRHLLPRCPPLAKIVAVDVSLDMVKYAKKHFSHPRICYDVLDIAGNGVPDFVRRYGSFDRVYSFFRLNWTNDQETGFKNIAELLKPGGGCLLLFRASGNLMRLNKKMAAMNHWQKYRKVAVPAAELMRSSLSYRRCSSAKYSFISGCGASLDRAHKRLCYIHPIKSGGCFPQLPRMLKLVTMKVRPRVHKAKMLYYPSQLSPGPILSSLPSRRQSPHPLIPQPRSKPGDAAPSTMPSPSSVSQLHSAQPGSSPSGTLPPPHSSCWPPAVRQFAHCCYPGRMLRLVTRISKSAAPTVRELVAHHHPPAFPAPS